MKKKYSILLGLTLILILVGSVFIFQVPIKLYFIEKNAISNYRANIEKFKALDFAENTEPFRTIHLEEDSLISVTFSDLDVSAWDSLYSLVPDSTSALAPAASSPFINLNKMESDAVYAIEKGRLLVDGKRMQNWVLTFSGGRSDNRLLALLKTLHIDQTMFNKQLNALRQINCVQLTSHRKGIELSYNEGIVLQSGCVVGTQYPAKYNLGDRLSRKNDKEELDENVQFYMDVR